MLVSTGIDPRSRATIEWILERFMSSKICPATVALAQFDYSLLYIDIQAYIIAFIVMFTIKARINICMTIV